ncbi:hypothetical protein ACHAWC_003452 [Mediolabrus comicus]
MMDKMSEEEAASPSATNNDKATPEEAPVSDDVGVGSKDDGVETAIDRQSDELDDTQRETFARDQTGILGPNKRGSSTGSNERKSRGSSLSSALKRLSFGGGGGGGGSSSSKRLASTKRRRKTNNNATATKKVHFENITIREYEVQPSDNPSAMTGGVGIELGWKYNILTNNYSIDHFEQQRQHQRLKQYQNRPLPPTDRVKLLKEEFGYTDNEIEEARKRAEQLQKERERSIKRLKYDWFDLLMENLFCCRSSSSSSSVVVIDGGGGSSSSRVSEGEKMKSDDDEEKERLHPTILVDKSVEGSSFFK